MAWYSFKIVYKPGPENIAAYALSRKPDYQRSKPKYAHFADQRGFPLEQVKLFRQSDKIVTAWKYTSSTYSIIQTLYNNSTMTNVPENTAVP